MADLTPDEPYVADLGDREANRSAQRGARGRTNGHRLGAPDDKPAESVQPKSFGKAPSPAYTAKLDELEAKLAKGEALTDEDLRVVTQMGAINLLRAPRPSVRATALKILDGLRAEAPKPVDPPAGSVTPAGPAVSPGLNTP